MPRPRLEIADIFRAHGPAWRRTHAGHVGLSQLKVMSAIEDCRTEALGGHVAGCAKCGRQHIAYNSCKNRHCPKCQGPAARLDERAVNADLNLPRSAEAKFPTSAVGDQPVSDPWLRSLAAGRGAWEAAEA